MARNVVGMDGPEETVRVYSLEQDGEDVNVLCNGIVVGFFGPAGDFIPGYLDEAQCKLTHTPVDRRSRLKITHRN